MKTKTKPDVDRLSPESEEEPLIIASKRKASPLATLPSTAKGPKTNMPKRLRASSAATASPSHSLGTSPPSNSTALFSSIPATPTTPQTPSKPAIIGTGQLSARKQRIIHDPINISIYDLRKQALDWNDIAEKTNSTCKLVGTDAELTGPACYSRFFRNGSFVARDKGEEWKREWYLNMKGPVVGVVAAKEVKEEERGDEKVEDGQLDVVEAEVAKAVEKVRGRFWEDVRKMVNSNLPDQDLTVEEVKAVHFRPLDRET